jgi:hypothetical protein
VQAGYRGRALVGKGEGELIFRPLRYPLVDT